MTPEELKLWAEEKYNVEPIGSIYDGVYCMLIHWASTGVDGKTALRQLSVCRSYADARVWKWEEALYIIEGELEKCLHSNHKGS